MITNAILLVFQGFINLLLGPLEIINIGIDFVSSIPIINDFMGVIYYVLPWDNLAPLVLLNISIIVFRIAMALIKLIKSFIPTMGG